ncbi:hypothetical protein LTS00_017218 [Friedmanniomyces endolithicus]|nr:hypothetical protein LTS00_017218 [Friedmanniomyces endolithicus]
MLGSRIWTWYTQYSAALQQAIGMSSNDIDANVRPIYQFSEDWEVLGPFQTGTRGMAKRSVLQKAVWGADPLELHGGFRALEYSEQATLKSSLAFNATIQWSKVKAKLSDPRQTQQASADLSVDFPHVEWRSFQDVYGWPALQWQGWARGEIFVQQGVGTITLALHAEHVLEFWVDGKHHFGGDWYGYGRAATTLHLEPGRHRIDIRLVRELRRDGATDEPALNVRLRMQGQGALVQAVLPEINGGYNLLSGILMSDIVGDANGPFASSHASVTLRNDAQVDAHVYAIEGNHNQCEVEFVGAAPVTLVAGQTKPVAFRIACVPPAGGRGPIRVTLKYRLVRDLYAPQKLTFMHPGGMVSYAVLRPPSPNAHCGTDSNVSAPVLLAMHGAGLEADKDLVRHALDELPDLCAWTLFPTGVTPWSGDDWHTWGFADVEAAISAIPDWIKQVGWEGPGVDVDRWLVTGHSNGGQGVWYALTHHPDRIIAAAALSGYSSIQNYVPYSLWRTADPGKTQIAQSALNSYRHELLLENIKAIPVFQQHGEKDDNVPPYNSRLLKQLIYEAEATSDYHEMPGKPHWWDGVMTTEPLKHFLRSQLNTGGPVVAEEPPNLQAFTVVSAGQGTVARYGLDILQLLNPGQVGKLRAEYDPLTPSYSISQSNVLSFRIPAWFQECPFISVNGQMLAETPESDGITSQVVFRHSNGTWLYSSTASDLPPRQGKQLGAMDAILSTRGAFQITHLSPAAQHIALQISRNLCQYFGADTKITNDYNEARAANGSNLITIAIGRDLPTTPESPISFSNSRLEIHDQYSPYPHIYAAANHLAAVWLRPLPDERLDLVVWGADEEGLGIAARLVPLMTGTGQPDFVVADQTMLWKGLEGTLALGYFDVWWKVSRGSYFT